jgi:tetratricopeptide (TPR) repeat protein
METKFEKHQRLYISLLLAVVVLAVYLPVRKHDFIRYDDDKYVTSNRNIQSGINEQSLRWAFTKSHESNWHPLTWISHMLDYQLFGLNAGAHHLENVFFHIINTLLLFFVLNRMTKAIWPSFFIAAVFGLHPLHVESVAWVAERKDVLSTFFWLLTMLAYISYIKKSDTKRLMLTLLLFATGLLAKPMLVTLPFVLLLLDYWPLERMQIGAANKSKNTGNDDNINSAGGKNVLALVREKVPFFILAIISSIVTLIVQNRGGAVQTVDELNLKMRVGNAIVAYTSYITKMLWPSKLGVLYPLDVNKLTIAKILICLLLLVSITIAVIFLSRCRKYLVSGWFWYVGTLIPVIGLVQVGDQSMADRYTYIPMTGLLIIIAWGMNDLLWKWKYRKKALLALSLCVLAAMSVKTSLQLKYWQNSETLFKHTLDVTGSNYVMENNYGNYLNEAGQQPEKAIEHLKKSIAINPESAEVHNNLANILIKLNKIDEAIAEYKLAIKCKTDFPEPHHKLAIALVKQNKIDEAIKEYYEALRLDPDNVDKLSNLGFELAQKGNYSHAVEFYNKALSIDPGNILTHGRLGLALSAQGKNEQALKEFQIVIKARPNDVEMWGNIGILFERLGKNQDAIASYRKALQISPEDEKAKTRLNMLSATKNK